MRLASLTIAVTIAVSIAHYFAGVFATLATFSHTGF